MIIYTNNAFRGSDQISGLLEEGDRLSTSFLSYYIILTTKVGVTK